jgi:hypothetical protein
MIHALYNRLCEALERPTAQTQTLTTEDFANLFGSATKSAAPSDSGSIPIRTLPGTQPTLGDPDVQGWLDSFYKQRGAETSATGTAGGMSATTSYQAADGAGTNYTKDTVYGPDQIFQQALANQCGNAFAALSGVSATGLTSQLPGIPSEQAQTAFDGLMAEQNAQRLASGQPIDTAAYWSDPGSVTMGGTTYTSKQLGYCGLAQSSGAEPIFISQANQVAGTDTFTVPGYEGTVKGIEAGRYYTLDQLQHAGLKAGQPDAQFYPGSWTQTTSV